MKTPSGGHQITQIEALVLAQERGRAFPSSVVAGLLAIPIAFVTFIVPLVWGAELWFVFVMDALFVGGFILWRALETAKSAFRAARARPNIARLLDGDTLVHWRYDADEWRRFAEHEYRRDRMISAAFMPLRQTVLTSLVAGAIIGGMMLLVSSSDASLERPDPIPQGIIMIVVGAGFGLPLLYKFVHTVAGYLGDRKAADQRQDAPEIRINAEGMHGAPSGYVAFLPRATRFTIQNSDGLSILEVAVSRTYRHRYGRYARSTVERILIPRGHESEAEMLTKMVIK